jgi:hypothetical protein
VCRQGLLTRHGGRRAGNDFCHEILQFFLFLFSRRADRNNAGPPRSRALTVSPAASQNADMVTVFNQPNDSVKSSADRPGSCPGLCRDRRRFRRKRVGRRGPDLRPCWLADRRPEPDKADGTLAPPPRCFESDFDGSRSVAHETPERDRHHPPRRTNTDHIPDSR